jgi:hypothetical protein
MNPANKMGEIFLTVSTNTLHKTRDSNPAGAPAQYLNLLSYLPDGKPLLRR